MEKIVSQIANKTVIIAPLDWGLGHATRCIPIIRELLKYDNRCIIATSGRSLELLKQEFPTLIFEEIPSYGITYGKNSFTTIFKLLFQIPKSIITKTIERKIADELVEKYSVDIIISDNRFGMHSELCKSIFITHQIRILLPFYIGFLEYPFFMVNRAMISKFDECWIPDYAGSKNLSGILSHSWSIPNTHFIGPISGREITNCEQKFDLVAILSGPEPQRSIFEAKLRSVLPSLPYKSCLVRGVLATKNHSVQVGNLTIQTFAMNAEINKLLCGSKLIISRAGYSSIMDYEKLGIKAILVPTPGQSEQVYLGKYLQYKSNYWFIQQSKLVKKLPEVIKEIIG